MTDSTTNLIFASLLPMFYKSAFVIQDYCSRIRNDYLMLMNPLPPELATRDDSTSDDITTSLYMHRRSLRRLVGDSEDALETLKSYMTFQGLTHWREGYDRVSRDCKQIHVSALRLEVEVRDCLQLQAGETAIQESRKSIELSCLQIEENRRGRSLAHSPTNYRFNY